jgi:hypothetical protein
MASAGQVREGRESERERERKRESECSIASVDADLSTFLLRFPLLSSFPRRPPLHQPHAAVSKTK